MTSITSPMKNSLGTTLVCKSLAIAHRYQNCQGSPQQYGIPLFQRGLTGIYSKHFQFAPEHHPLNQQSVQRQWWPQHYGQISEADSRQAQLPHTVLVLSVFVPWSGCPVSVRCRIKVNAITWVPIRTDLWNWRAIQPSMGKYQMPSKPGLLVRNLCLERQYRNSLALRQHLMIQCQSARGRHTDRPTTSLTIVQCHSKSQSRLSLGLTALALQWPKIPLRFLRLKSLD